MALVSCCGVLMRWFEFSGLAQGPDNGAFGQFYFEGIMTEALCAGQQQLGSSPKIFFAGRFTYQISFGFGVSPGLVGYPAEGNTGGGDGITVQFQRGRYGYQREGIRLAVAHFQVGVVASETVGGQVDGR